MKFLEKGEENGPYHILELSERNLRTLLEKLTDPNSQRTLMDPDRRIFVKAVDDVEHYSDRPAGIMLTNGEFK